MTRIRGDATGMRFIPDGSGGGWLEWDEIVVRRGFRPRRVRRRIRKEALAQAPEPKEVL
jgi:hypothetical protein